MIEIEHVSGGWIHRKGSIELYREVIGSAPAQGVAGSPKQVLAHIKDVTNVVSTG